jgi:hypothetical protein
MLRVAVIMFALIMFSSAAAAADRFALLIGNQHYRENVGPLINPHTDIALVGAALESLGFKVTSIKDAGYKTLETAVKTHIQNVRHAGKGTLSIIYYSGHGASDPDTKINYLIPVDVDSADDTSLWTNSLELSDLINKLRLQSPEAIHYVVFDACREELHLTRQGKKAMGSEKGFVPVGNITGVMIAYATAPGRTASDAGQYAKAIADEIVKPGIEAVTMFRNVQLKVKQAIGQDPWLSFPTLPAVYFAGAVAAEAVELNYWYSVKDSTSPVALASYLERYPNGEFASVARALISHYEEQDRAVKAAAEEETKRQDEARKAAEVVRLEDERRTREAEHTQDRRRAEQARDEADRKRLEEQQHVELIARAGELRKALEEARVAREAANAAEEQRLAAVKRAEEATKAAEQTIASEREAKVAHDPTKLAALPNITKPSTLGYDGVWIFTRSTSERCTAKNSVFTVTIANGIVRGPGGKGSITPTGAIWVPGVANTFSGTLTANAGRGTYRGRCTGTFTARRR